MARPFRIPNVLNKENLQKLFENIEDPEIAIGCILGLFCGLRKSEVCNIKTENVDLVNLRLKIENSKNPGKVEYGYGKDRIVPIPPVITSLLKKFIDYQNNSKYLFPSIYNKETPISREHFYKKYRESMKKSGLFKTYKSDTAGRNIHLFNFHTLRHTYATLLWERTGDIYAVKSALGHTDIKTTMVYTHVSNKVLKEKVESAFNPYNQLNFSVGGQQSMVSKDRDPFTVLNLRLAKGEIDLQTYRHIFVTLTQKPQTNYIG